MGGVGGVLHDTFCFAGASCKENVQDGGERGTNDFCSGFFTNHQKSPILEETKITGS